jgi:peptidoglycan/xylan/chitin deacetylase (PgdA/CDA1 family)
MNLLQIWNRIQGRYRSTANSIFFNRPLKMCNKTPYITFTFDDFPSSALHIGGKILMQYKLRGTYYAALGLMGSMGPSGKIFMQDDIKYLLEQGHELGCHTFSHCQSSKTPVGEFENSIVKNKNTLNALIPGATFKSFSYPIDGPYPQTKRKVAKYFDCCRLGGQTYNVGTIDLNLLKAYFLERARNNVGLIKDIIDTNAKYRGWLILATHDVSVTPSPYGCTPSLFEIIVEYSMASGATILPINAALEAIRNGVIDN